MKQIFMKFLRNEKNFKLIFFSHKNDENLSSLDAKKYLEFLSQHFFSSRI